MSVDLVRVCGDQWRTSKGLCHRKGGVR
jgi:hypothetical protein